MGGAERYSLGMVSGRAGDNAAGFLFVAELRNLVVCASEFERTGKLEIFGLQKNIGFGIDFWRRNYGSLACDVLQDRRRIENLVNL